MLADGELRAFVARLMGWGCERAVDEALASIELATVGRAHLVLCGAGDLVPIAYALHRRTLGAARPFIVCDPRRGNTPASVRAPANHESGAAAIEAAAGGTLCVRQVRLPQDFASIAPRLRATGNVQYVVCAGEEGELHPLLVVPAPFRLRSPQDRVDEMPRVVDEYAHDARLALGAGEPCFTAGDRAWVIEHASTSLSEIEKATLRIVALRTSKNVSSAAARLGMAAVSLSRWLGRREQLRT